ncbi:unnamed protein product [Vitrella brassicaformis CCMP3155]|uniref:Origin recognition complex subunit 2 RecA-like domain-containing protein n=2 Tax=Vitrella brassicaformis TaxID=1169539 RepID=A0A0G4EFH5_VITBC|nr:unnamed protein product [Vitrella brassicaformis CCMP3155]|eukprot:CEL94746.1 unnamed protein product [Vitrella brassicaformis CCMP3155]
MDSTVMFADAHRPYAVARGQAGGTFADAQTCLSAPFANRLGVRFYPHVSGTLGDGRRDNRPAYLRQSAEFFLRQVEDSVDKAMGPVARDVSGLIAGIGQECGVGGLPVVPLLCGPSEIDQANLMRLLASELAARLPDCHIVDISDTDGGLSALLKRLPCGTDTHTHSTDAHDAHQDDQHTPAAPAAPQRERRKSTARASFVSKGAELAREEQAERRRKKRTQVDSEDEEGEGEAIADLIDDNGESRLANWYREEADKKGRRFSIVVVARDVAAISMSLLKSIGSVRQEHGISLFVVFGVGAGCLELHIPPMCCEMEAAGLPICVHPYQLLDVAELIRTSVLPALVLGPSLLPFPLSPHHVTEIRQDIEMGSITLWQFCRRVCHLIVEFYQSPSSAVVRPEGGDDTTADDTAGEGEGWDTWGAGPEEMAKKKIAAFPAPPQSAAAAAAAAAPASAALSTGPSFPGDAGKAFDATRSVVAFYEGAAKRLAKQQVAHLQGLAAAALSRMNRNHVKGLPEGREAARGYYTRLLKAIKDNAIKDNADDGSVARLMAWLRSARERHVLGLKLYHLAAVAFSNQGVSTSDGASHLDLDRQEVTGIMAATAPRQPDEPQQPTGMSPILPHAPIRSPIADLSHHVDTNMTRSFITAGTQKGSRVPSFLDQARRLLRREMPALTQRQRDARGMQQQGGVGGVADKDEAVVVESIQWLIELLEALRGAYALGKGGASSSGARQGDSKASLPAGLRQHQQAVRAYVDSKKLSNFEQRIKAAQAKVAANRPSGPDRDAQLREYVAFWLHETLLALLSPLVWARPLCDRFPLHSGASHGLDAHQPAVSTQIAMAQVAKGRQMRLPDLTVMYRLYEKNPGLNMQLQDWFVAFAETIVQHETPLSLSLVSLQARFAVCVVSLSRMGVVSMPAHHLARAAGCRGLDDEEDGEEDKGGVATKLPKMLFGKVWYTDEMEKQDKNDKMQQKRRASMPAYLPAAAAAGLFGGGPPRRRNRASQIRANQTSNDNKDDNGEPRTPDRPAPPDRASQDGPHSPSPHRNRNLSIARHQNSQLKSRMSFRLERLESNHRFRFDDDRMETPPHSPPRPKGQAKPKGRPKAKAKPKGRPKAKGKARGRSGAKEVAARRGGSGRGAGASGGGPGEDRRREEQDEPADVDVCPSPQPSRKGPKSPPRDDAGQQQKAKDHSARSSDEPLGGNRGRLKRRKTQKLVGPSVPLASQPAPVAMPPVGPQPGEDDGDMFAIEEEEEQRRPPAAARRSSKPPSGHRSDDMVPAPALNRERRRSIAPGRQMGEDDEAPPKPPRASPAAAAAAAPAYRRQNDRTAAAAAAGGGMGEAAGASRIGAWPVDGGGGGCGGGGEEEAVFEAVSLDCVGANIYSKDRLSCKQSRALASGNVGALDRIAAGTGRGGAADSGRGLADMVIAMQEGEGAAGGNVGKGGRGYGPGIKNRWDHWRHLLLSGFSLCFYGFGSKKKLLREFVQQGLAPREGNCFVEVCGYDSRLLVSPAATSPEPLRAPLERMLRDSAQRTFIIPQPEEETSEGRRDEVREAHRVLQRHHTNLTHSHHTSNNADDMATVVEEFLCCVRGSRQPTVLLVHGLDSTPLTDPQTRQYLTQLAKEPKLLFVASVDRVDFPFLFAPSDLQAYNFYYTQAHTGLQYLCEVAGSLGDTEPSWWRKMRPVQRKKARAVRLSAPAKGQGGGRRRASRNSDNDHGNDGQGVDMDIDD